MIRVSVTSLTTGKITSRNFQNTADGKMLAISVLRQSAKELGYTGPTLSETTAYFANHNGSIAVQRSP